MRRSAHLAVNLGRMWQTSTNNTCSVPYSPQSNKVNRPPLPQKNEKPVKLIDHRPRNLLLDWIYPKAVLPNGRVFERFDVATFIHTKEEQGGPPTHMA